MAGSNPGTGEPTMGTETMPGAEEPDWAAMEEDFEQTYQAALDAFYSAIQKEYNTQSDKLNTSKEKYREGLKFSKDRDGVSATVEGWLPVAVEEGAKSFDMKPGLLKNTPWRTIRLHSGVFRIVSIFSPAGSWWHPGITPRNISENVKSEEDNIKKDVVDPILNEFWSRIGA